MSTHTNTQTEAQIHTQKDGRISIDACMCGVSDSNLVTRGPTYTSLLLALRSLSAAACGWQKAGAPAYKQKNACISCCSAAPLPVAAVTRRHQRSPCPPATRCAGEQHIGAARGVGTLRATRHSPLSSPHLMHSAQPGTRVVCRPLAAGLASSSGHCAGSRLTFFRMFEEIPFCFRGNQLSGKDMSVLEVRVMERQETTQCWHDSCGTARRRNLAA